MSVVLVQPVRKNWLWVWLEENDSKFAKQAWGNYFPFSRMECLQTITDFEFNSRSGKDCLDYFSTADCNNTWVCYWNINCKIFSVAIWVTNNFLWDMRRTNMGLEIAKRSHHLHCFRDISLHFEYRWYFGLRYSKLWDCGTKPDYKQWIMQNEWIYWIDCRSSFEQRLWIYC